MSRFTSNVSLHSQCMFVYSHDELQPTTLRHAVLRFLIKFFWMSPVSRVRPGGPTTFRTSRQYGSYTRHTTNITNIGTRIIMLIKHLRIYIYRECMLL